MLDLRKEVEALALPGGRMVGTAGHERARRNLDARLRALAFSPYRGETFALPYRAAAQDFCNLIAVAPGRDRSLAPLLIGAHYDSAIAAPCADDNAAAVAIALACGEQLLYLPLDRDVVLAFFDAEEPGWFRTAAMGSIRFYEDQRREDGFHAAVVMDLVGHDVPVAGPELAEAVPDFSQLLFVMGAESHPELPPLVRAYRQPGLPVLATLNRRVGDLSDHGIFRVHGVPYLFLSCGRWEHYHQPSDTPDRLNYAKMALIRDYVLALLAALDGKPLGLPGGRPVPEHDTTEFEVELIRSVLGEKGLPVLMRMLGIARLETSADLDVLASRLQGYFSW